MGLFDFLKKRKNVSAPTTVQADPAPRQTLRVDEPSAPVAETNGHGATEPATGSTTATGPAARASAGTRRTGGSTARTGTRTTSGTRTGTSTTKTQTASGAKTGGTTSKTGAKAGTKRGSGAAASRKTGTGARTTGARRATSGAQNGRRTQYEHDGYRLFQNGNRYFFSKKAQKDVEGQPVYDLPAGRTVTKTPNGLPVLKKQ